MNGMGKNGACWTVIRIPSRCFRWSTSRPLWKKECVVSVARCFPGTVTWSDTWMRFTWARERSNAPTVTRSLHAGTIWLYIWEYTQAKGRTLVLSARSRLHSVQISMYTWGHTLEKSRTFAKHVGKWLLIATILKLVVWRNPEETCYKVILNV